MSNFKTIKDQLNRDELILNAIKEIIPILKTVLRECKKDEMCLNFVEDLLLVLEKNDQLLAESDTQINFEIQKEKSARCKNLDEFIAMIFNDK